MKNSISNILQHNAFLAVIGGTLLGLSFPPSPVYSFAYVAFLPLLLVMERAHSWISLIRHSYLFTFFLHATTLYWTGGFVHMRDPWMMAAGGALLVIHPLFYLPSLLAARWVWKRLGRLWGLTAFVVFWLAFEYSHMLGEFSFPWITLGNSQAYDLPRAQLAAFASVLGLSGIVLAFNAIAFLVLLNLADGTWELRRGPGLRAGLMLLLIYIGPWVYGYFAMRSHDGASDAKITLSMLQPNVDPWEKWGADRLERWRSYDKQFTWHLDATRRVAAQRPDIIVWSETAIPFHILDPRYADYRMRLQSVIDSSGSPILTGLPSSRFFPTDQAPVTARPIEGTGMSYESYNSAIMLSPGMLEGPVYRKVVLVPFAERIPNAKGLKFLIEPLRWNVGISSWGKGADTIVHSFRMRTGDTAHVGAMICYESVFPNFVRHFTLKGAQFLAILTNDSWWGNTSGAYQHAAYASLRAIETRRWIVQCANGGISLVVRPNGIVDRSTELYSERVLTASVGLSTGETFYVRWGDWFGFIVVLAAALLLLAALLVPMISKERP